MVLLLLASLLAAPSTSAAPPTIPLGLRDSRFHYRVSALIGPATARTRTLWVEPGQGNRPAQVIALGGPAAQEPATNIVLRDVNFDGQPDLMLTSGRGNVNSQYAYWLYDTSTQQFVLNSAMSNTIGGSQVTFDAATRQIVTQSRFSCCDHQTRTYAFQRGKLKLLKTKTEKTSAAPAGKSAAK